MMTTQVSIECPACNGKGIDPFDDKGEDDCLNCGGKGRVYSIELPAQEFKAPRQTLADDWAQAYSRLHNALVIEHKAATALSEAKQVHADAVMNVVLEYADKPKELGANDAVREARIALLTEEAATSLRDAEKAMAQAKHETELARIGMQYVREMRRILVGVEVSE